MGRLRPAIVSAGLALALLGCGAGDTREAYPESPLDGDEVGVDPEDLPPPASWRAIGTMDVDDFGHAGWISIPYPADQRHIALRIAPSDGDPDAATRPCYQVKEAELASGTVLVPNSPALSPRHQRLLPGPGAGFFVLSTTVDALDTADTLGLRVELVDCAIGVPASRSRFAGMPSQLRVEITSEDEAFDDDRVIVPVRILRAEDSGWGPLGEDPVITQAWAVAVERFAAAGFRLVLQAEETIPELDTLLYEADMLDLSEVDTAVRDTLMTDADDTRFVPVILAACLEYDDPVEGTRARPQGQVSRLPGSLADPSTPSLVMLSAGHCKSTEAEATLDPELYGVVLAHEIGHYLGVLHTDIGGDHLSSGPHEQLMNSAIAKNIAFEDAWFSEAQAWVMRRHPDVVLSAE